MVPCQRKNFITLIMFVPHGFTFEIIQRWKVYRRFCTHLKEFASRHGKPGLYHETITWAYFLLIQERAKKNDHDCWEKFVENNADLFDWKNSILKQYYTQETLQSSLARSIFVLPDARYQMSDARDAQIPEQR